MNTTLHKNQDNARLQNQPDQFSPGRQTDNEPSAKGTVYDLITQRIIALLEQGNIPWQKPWKVQTGLPRNLISKKPYRGVNVFLLHAMHYESPFWLTFNQAKQLGATIRKGERACPVVFWKQFEVEDKATGEKTKIPLLRYYYVFNLSQCDGLKDSPTLAPDMVTTKPGEIVANMPNRPKIKHGMAKAFYSPGGDFVGMPSPERFQSEDAYFSVLFHELTHSTGHSSRLNRPGAMDGSGFGSEDYSKEELVAELGAAFLCGHAGIAERTLTNSAAYVQNWLEALRNDNKLIVQAAAQSQRAADYILATKFDEPAEN